MDPALITNSNSTLFVVWRSIARRVAIFYAFRFNQDSILVGELQVIGGKMLHEQELIVVFTVRNSLHAELYLAKYKLAVTLNRNENF